MKLLPEGDKSQWPTGRYTTREACKMAYYLVIFPDDFAQVKEPRDSENKIAKKRYTSIVALIISIYSVGALHSP